MMYSLKLRKLKKVHIHSPLFNWLIHDHNQKILIYHSDEAAIDERRFGIRLEQERMEFNHFQQMNVPDYHITCSMPAPAQWPSMLKQAEDRFNTLLAISQQEALNNGGNARELLASRLRTRFNEGMCFSIV